MRCTGNARHDHPPVEHDEFYCPLCVALEDTSGYEDALYQLEAEYAELQALAADLDIADILHAQAAEAAAQTTEAAARRQLQAVADAAWKRRTDTMGKRLARIDAELRIAWQS